MYTIEAIGEDAVAIRRGALLAEFDWSGADRSGWIWDEDFGMEGLIPTKCPRAFEQIRDLLRHAYTDHKALGCYD